MSKFSYKAKHGPDKVIEGVIEADTLEGAISKILHSGKTPIDVKKKGGDSRPRLNLGITFRGLIFRRVPQSEVTLFTRQISDLVDADIPVLQVLHIVGQQTKHPQFKDIIEKMFLYVKDGGSLSSAMVQFPRVFPALYSNMVKSGELAGNLNVILSRLADLMEKDQEIRSQIKTSLMYPALILFVGAIVVFVIMTWGIPRIAPIFADLNETLPVPTLILLGTSAFLSRFWWVIALLVCLGIFYFRRVQSTSQGKHFFDGLKLRIPLFGSYIKDTQIGRFARILGTLLDSGVSIISAMESVCLVLENDILKQEIQKAAQKIKDGASLAGALKESSLFPETVINMVSVGEQTGHVHKGLYKLASYYESQSARFVKRITSLIEPVLILSVGSVIAFIVMAMLLPVFKMNLIIQ